MTQRLPIGILVLDRVWNELARLLPLVPAFEAALGRLVPCSYVLVRAEA